MIMSNMSCKLKLQIYESHIYEILNKLQVKMLTIDSI